MSSLLIPKSGDMEFDKVHKVTYAGRVWTIEEISAMLGEEFESMHERWTDRTYLLEKGWDDEKSDLSFNKTATSVIGIVIKGAVLICEDAECRHVLSD
jgi:hypothetical protein